MARICGRDIDLEPYLQRLDAQTLEFEPAADGDVTILAHPFPGRAVEAKLGRLRAEPTS